MIQRTDEEQRLIRWAEFPAAMAVERAYQDHKWGGAPHDRQHSLAEWALILSREVGEVMHELGRVHWQNGDTSDLRAELVQVAAVCHAISDVIEQGDW